ncbi:MAG: PEGA domain-containing protein [Myxococcaceae bacterium]
MRWLMVLTMVGSLPVLAGPAAGPKTLAVATGNCADPELTGAMRVFTGELQQRLGPDAIDPEEVLRRFRPQPSMSLDELQALIQTAQSQYWAIEHQEAGQNVQRAMAELEKVSPLAHPWKQMAFALVIDGLVHRNLGRKLEMAESWRRVLRVEPGHKLDPGLYSPSVRAQFELLRKELAAGKKLTLSVNTPKPGAEVFIEGMPVGKTPFSEQFPPGRYRVAVARGESVSFGHLVKLEQDSAQLIDIEFEAALVGQAPLCIHSDGSTGRALRLAALAGADAVVVFRWANAVLVEVADGARVREGGFKTTSPARNQRLAELAAFVLSGTPSAAVVAVPAGGAAKAAAPGAAKSSAPAAATRPPVASPAARSTNRLRLASYAVGGAGLLSLAAGGALWLSGAGDRTRLGQLTGASRSLPVAGTPDYHEAVRLVGTNRANASLSTGLSAAGGVALACGLGLFLYSGHGVSEEPELAIVPRSDGLGVAGRF